jgi:pyruvate,water dikinase
VHDLVDLRDADASFGNKAAGLARLIAAGLPVPPGFAIAARVFERVVGPLRFDDLDVAGHAIDAAAQRIEQAELPAELARELRAHLRELGSTVIVRSSSPIEDGSRGAGAGVFESSDPLPCELDRVWHAIRSVWTSALAPAAIAYARGRTQVLGLGVIVQHFIAGERVTVYTRSPSGGDELVIQRGDTLLRTPRVQLPSELVDQHAVIQALRAERMLGVPADVELVQVRARAMVDEPEADRMIQTWVVQARPIVIAPRRAPLSPPPPIVLAPLRDGRVWSWDVTHNPDPLSPAQRGLVEQVERERLGEHELRVVAGYLYTSPRESTNPVFVNELASALVARCRELEAKAEQILAAPGSADTLAHALATYSAFYALWANELAPRIAELRTRAHGSLSSRRSHRPSSVEAAIAACARGAIELAELVRRIGAVSPTWDVAVATFGERAELLHQAVALARATPMTTREATVAARATANADPHGDLSAAERAELLALELRSENMDLTAIVADLAERDDLLFARAQQLVRNALLARGAELGIGDDIFWIDLEQARVGASSDPFAAQRDASAARSANERAARWQMPLVVGSPEPSPQTTENRRKTLHGVGTGPRVTGRVVRFASLASAVLASPGDVVVVRAVTPALAVFVGRCAALVSETGGLLDHGAALARELGITCVVGCRDAWTSLHDNDTVDVDGDAGMVTRH